MGLEGSCAVEPVSCELASSEQAGLEGPFAVELASSEQAGLEGSFAVEPVTACEQRAGGAGGLLRIEGFCEFRNLRIHDFGVF